METIQKIGKIEAIFLIVMVTVNEIIFNIPNSVIMNSGSSSWLTILLHFSLIIIFVLILSKFFKELGPMDLVDVSEYLGGKVLKWIIGILYVILIIVVSSYILRYFSNLLELIYFDHTPTSFLLLLFLVGTLFTAKKGIQTISFVNLLLSPIMLLSLLVIIFSTFKDIVPERIFPIFGLGTYETFISGFSTIFTFGGIAYLYFLMPILKNPEDYKKTAVLSITISGIYMLLSVLCLIMVFPYAAFTDETLSMYLLTRRITFGEFFQRIDAMFILFWILSVLVFLSMNLHFANTTLKKLTNIKYGTKLNYGIAFIIFSLALYYKSIVSMKYVLNVYIKYAFIALCLVLSFIIMLLAYLKHKRENA
ncbi:MAG: GerAB/ArcD/ProY family transporter [Clostridia bacterium]|nr:GerAB/ArcD/ProY family transporter [Clostridia bacterium]